MNNLFCWMRILLISSIFSTTISAQSSSKNFTGPVIYINLMRPSENNSVLVDGVAAMYSNTFSCSVDSNDAIKLYNISQGISLSRDGRNLSIEARQIPQFKDTLFIQLWALKQASYSLQIVPQNLPLNMPGKAWLIDEYLHTKKEIDLNNPTSYDFAPNNDAGSYLNRFIIVYNRLRIANAIKVESNGLHNSDSSNITNPLISLYPNPVVGNIINLKFENINKGDYTVTLSNGNGNTIFVNKLHHTGGNKNYSIVTNSNKINSGLYTLVVSNPNGGKTIHLPVIINK